MRRLYLITTRRSSQNEKRCTSEENYYIREKGYVGMVGGKSRYGKRRQKHTHLL